MRTFTLINEHLIIDEGGKRYTIDEMPGLLHNPREAVRFAIVPASLGRILASKRTIDATLSQQYPGNNTFSSEPLDVNLYQVYVASEALLNRLRSFSKRVSIIPYPAAVRHAIAGERRMPGFLGRTRVLLSSSASTEAEDRDDREKVVVDCIGDDFLFTVLRGHEVLACRFALGGDPVIEMQRTLASSQVADPLIVTKDNQLMMELKAQGYNINLSDAPGHLVGESGFNKVMSLRFMNDMEIAAIRAAEGRTRSVLVFLVALMLAGSAYAAEVIMKTRLSAAEATATRIEAERNELLAQLRSLNQERYGSIATQDSLRISEELFDLALVLTPQVAILSLEKDHTGVKATIERRPGAVPFSRQALAAMLEGSRFFAGATIKEEFDGHIIRYNLSRPFERESLPSLGEGAN